jgi:type II secretory pathway pseudopilin PulG
LVIVIISIVSAIAVPRVGGFAANQRAEAAARRVVVELAHAKQLARRTSVAVTVRVTASAATLELVGQVSRDRAAGAYIVDLGDEPYRVTVVSADFGGDEDVIFDGFGVPDSGGSVVVQVGSFTKTITLDADTGDAS